MAVLSPATADLIVRHDLQGRLSIYFRGEKLPGVFNIEVGSELRERAVVKVSIIGLAVRFETESE